jgi:hypothetical protein
MKAPTLIPALTPRLTNLAFVGDASSLASGAGEYALAASYRFPVDSVIRWITVSSEISIGNATINQGGVGVLLGSAGQNAGLMTDTNSTQFVFNHTSQQFLGNVYGSQRALQINMNDTMVNTGTNVAIYIAAILSTPPFANIAFAVNVSIAATPLIEWQRSFYRP